MPRAPVLLVVGVTEDQAAHCASAASDADVGFRRSAEGISACRAIRDEAPTVVAVASTLWRDEREAIIAAASRFGARVVLLPHVAPPTWLARVLVAAARDERTRAQPRAMSAW